MRHFSRVCQNCTKNLLSARALGEIFSPMVFRQQSTRWISEHAPLRQTADRQAIGPVMEHADHWTCSLADKFRHAYTQQSISVTCGFQLYTHTHTHIGWSFSTQQQRCAIKGVKPELPSDLTQQRPTNLKGSAGVCFLLFNFCSCSHPQLRTQPGLPHQDHRSAGDQWDEWKSGGSRYAAASFLLFSKGGGPYQFPY